MNESQTMECDVLVIGSGAGGLSAAVAAAVRRLDVLLIEKEPFLGGTTAQSGGWLWVPCSPHARRAGIDDTAEKARTYLKHETGSRYDGARSDVFLAAGPEMIDFFERKTAVKFFLGADYPDYHPDAPGALPGGRAVCALQFDGRALGENLRLVRQPPRQLTLFGIKVGSGPDDGHFANAQRSLRSTLYVAKRILVHCAQVVLYGRDVILMSGNALVGRLVKSALDRGVRLKVSTAATGLILKDGRVVGVTAAAVTGAITIIARRGVVCAAGGFSHDLARRRRLYPQCAETDEYYSLACTGNTGDGLRIAEAVGAAVDESGASPAAWMPVSGVPCADGSLAPYLRSGYLKRGRTLDEIAAQTGMNARTLNDTVKRFNANAKEGRDTEFGRGANVYNVYQGDPANRPSACVAPLEKPPFYAVQIYPGDLSTFAGLMTDDCARVLSVIPPVELKS